MAEGQEAAMEVKANMAVPIDGSSLTKGPVVDLGMLTRGASCRLSRAFAYFVVVPELCYC